MKTTAKVWTIKISVSCGETYHHTRPFYTDFGQILFICWCDCCFGISKLIGPNAYQEIIVHAITQSVVLESYVKFPFLGVQSDRLKVIKTSHNVQYNARDFASHLQLSTTTRNSFGVIRKTAINCVLLEVLMLLLLLPDVAAAAAV